MPREICNFDKVSESDYTLIESFSQNRIFFRKSISVDAKNPRPKIHDVARRAGVSPATVSRVLNHTAPVRENIRARVLDSLQALGYASARSTSATFQKTVALLIPDILNPFFPEIVRGVQDEASADGSVSLLFDTNEDPQRELQLLHMLSNQSLAGIIHCGSRSTPADLNAARRKLAVPMVILNRCLRQPGIACITVDFEKATYRATRHLLDLHHTRIAYLTGPTHSETSHARQQGIETALTEVGLPLRPDWCVASFPNIDGGFQAMSALLTLPAQERPTAVIVYNDVMALGVLHAIREHHLRVPEDFSVIGVDDIAMAAHSNPPLTTIAQPKYRMGRLAMRLIRQMNEGQPPPGDGYTLMESTLIVRESTAPLTEGIGKAE